MTTKEKSSAGKEVDNVRGGCALLDMLILSQEIEESHVAGEEGETLQWDGKLGKLARRRAHKSLQTLLYILVSLQEKDRTPLNGLSRTEVQSCLHLRRSAGCCQPNGL